MAWGFVQSVGAAAIASTETVTFANNVAAGNKIVVAVSVACLANTTTTCSSVKDAALNSWTEIGAKVSITGSTATETSLWALDVPAGDVGTKPVIKATASAATTVSVGLVACEISGLLAGSTLAMVDGTLASLAGTGGQSSTGSPAYSSTALNEFLVAIYGDIGNGATWTNPTGWQGATGGPGSGGSATGVNSSTDCNIELAYKNSTNGLETDSYAIAGTSSAWACLMVAFQLATVAIPSRAPVQLPPEMFPPLSRSFGPNAPFEVAETGPQLPPAAPVVAPFLWDAPRYPQHSPVPFIRRSARVASAPEIAVPFLWDAPRYTQRIAAKTLRRDYGQAPTGLPVPVQPPYAWGYERRWLRPPYPRRGVVPPTGLPVPVQPPFSWLYERRYLRPPYPRRGNVPPTGWPVPVQPPSIPESVRARFKPPYPRKGIVPESQLGQQVLAAPGTFTPGFASERLRRMVKRRGSASSAFATEPPVVSPVAFSPVRRIWLAHMLRHGQAITGWPVPVQPPSVPDIGIRRAYKPPWPRRGNVAPTGWPVPVQPPNIPDGIRFTGPRRRFLRSGVVALTNLPEPQQIPYATRQEQPRRRFLRYGGVLPPTGLPVPVQPPEASESTRQRFTRVLLFRRGNVAPTGWTVPVQPVNIPDGLRFVGPRRRFLRSGVVAPTNLPEPQQIPESQRIRQARERYLRYGGIVPPTGLPVPVQPPELPRSQRRWSRPLLPKRGIITLTGLGSPPVVVPPPTYAERRWVRPPYPRRGNAQPNSGLPVPVQPPTPSMWMRARFKPPWPRRGVTENVTPPPVTVNPPISQSERRWSKPPYPRRGVVPPTIRPEPQQIPIAQRQEQPRKRFLRYGGIVPSSGLPVPVQPPERIQSIRRWLRPPLFRRGVTENVAPVPVVPPIPFVPNEPHVRRIIRLRFGRTVQAPGIIPGPVPSVQRKVRYNQFTRVRREVTGVHQPPPSPPAPYLPSSIRRTQRIQWFRRGRAQPGSGLPVPVQPPERLQAIRRWLRPPWPRRGVVPPSSLPPIIITEVKLPVWVWLVNEIPDAEVTLVASYAAISILVPEVIATQVIPNVSVAVISPEVVITQMLPDVSITIVVPLAGGEEI